MHASNQFVSLDLFMKRFGPFRRFVLEDAGQDLVEYAFLAAFIGVAGYVALAAIHDGVLSTFLTWIDPAVGMPSLWEPTEPPSAP